MAIDTTTKENQERAEQEGEALTDKVILVVDDSPTVCKIVQVTLTKMGCRVVIAEDGLEALAKIEDEKPDLILLDIIMPHMDGYQVCSLIKKKPHYKHIPVVILSGKDGFFDKVRGRLAGSTGYITKPFQPDVLTETVEKHLTDRR
ncbi:MAG: response regulator [Anaerolineales bacterium]|nr:MAG: response regulator [Anaerolineales bacterium]